MNFLFKPRFSFFDVLAFIALLCIAQRGHIWLAMIALLAMAGIGTWGQDALDRRANKGDA